MGILESNSEDLIVRSETNQLIGKLQFGNDPVLIHSGPAKQARSAVTAAYQVTERVGNALHQVDVYQNSTLTPEAVQAVKADAHDVIVRYLQSVAANVDQHAIDARAEAAKIADAHRPKLSSDDALQAIRTDQAWNNSIKPMLEAGKGWDEIVNIVDTDGLLALQRFAPSHVALKEGKAEAPQIMAGINRMTANRAIELAPEGDARNALQGERDTQKYADAARVVVATLGSVRAARDLPAAGITVKRMAFEVGAQPGADPFVAPSAAE